MFSAPSQVILMATVPDGNSTPHGDMASDLMQPVTAFKFPPGFSLTFVNINSVDGSFPSPEDIPGIKGGLLRDVNTDWERFSYDPSDILTTDAPQETLTRFARELLQFITKRVDNRSYIAISAVDIGATVVKEALSLAAFNPDFRNDDLVNRICLLAFFGSLHRATNTSESVSVLSSFPYKLTETGEKARLLPQQLVNLAEYHANVAARFEQAACSKPYQIVSCFQKCGAGSPHLQVVTESCAKTLLANEVTLGLDTSHTQLHETIEHDQEEFWRIQLEDACIRKLDFYQQLLRILDSGFRRKFPRSLQTYKTLAELFVNKADVQEWSKSSTRRQTFLHISLPRFPVRPDALGNALVLALDSRINTDTLVQPITLYLDATSTDTEPESCDSRIASRFYESLCAELLFQQPSLAMQIWDVGLPEVLYAKGQMLFPELSRQLQGLLRKLLSCQGICRETYVVINASSFTIQAQNVVSTLSQILDRTDSRATILLLTTSPTQRELPSFHETPDLSMPHFCMENLDGPDFSTALDDDIREWVVTHHISPLVPLTKESVSEILSTLKGATSWSEVDQFLFRLHQISENENSTIPSLATEKPSAQRLSKAIRLHGNWLLVALLWIYHARRPLTLNELDEAVNFDLILGSEFLVFPGLEAKHSLQMVDSANYYEGARISISKCRPSIARDVMRALPGTVVVDSCYVFPTSAHVEQYLMDPENLKHVAAASPSAYLARSCLLQVKYELSKHSHPGTDNDTKSSLIEPGIMAEYAFASWSVHYSQSFPSETVSRPPKETRSNGETDLALEHLVADFVNSPAEVERWLQCIGVPVSKWPCLKPLDDLESRVEFSPASLRSRLKISLQQAASISATLATRFDTWNSQYDSLLLKAIYDNDWTFAGSLCCFLKESGQSCRKEIIAQALLTPFPKRTDLFERTLQEICSSLNPSLTSFPKRTDLFERTLQETCSSLDPSMTLYHIVSQKPEMLHLTITGPKRAEHIAYLARVASRLGDLSLVERILASLNDQEHNDSCSGGRLVMESETLLVAVASGQDKIVGKLLEVISPVNIHTEAGLTALMLASLNGFTSIVGLLLSREQNDINRKSRISGESALHLASRGGFYKTVALLLAPEHGVELFSRNSSGSLPLHLALAHGHLEVANLLMESMLEPAGTATIPPETKSLEPHHSDRAQVDDTDSSDSDSDSNSTSDSEHLEDDEDFSRDSAEERVKCPLDIKSSGTPAFVLAASQGYLKVCEAMESKGADTSLVDDNGMSALHHAAKIGSVDLVRFLLNCGLNVNLKASSGWTRWTPLNYAANYGHSEVVRLLLEYDNGSLLKLNEDDNFLPIEQALSRGHYHTVDALIEGCLKFGGAHSGLPQALLSAARDGPVSLVEQLLDHGVDIDTVDQYKNTALHLVAYANRVEVVKLLVLRKANLDCSDNGGFTPLMDATRRNAYSSLKVLINAGAKLDVLNDSGQSPLDLAIHHGSKECGKLLLAKLAKSGLIRLDTSSKDVRRYLNFVTSLSDQNCTTAVLSGLMATDSNSHESSSFKDFISSLLWDQWVPALEAVWDYWDISKLELGVYGTALHYAVIRHQSSVVKSILTRDKYRIQVDTESGKYGTALQAAIASQPITDVSDAFLDTVELLVLHGADLVIAGEAMAYVLQSAVFNRRGELATTLLGKLTPEVIHRCGGHHGTVLNALLAGPPGKDDFVEKLFYDLHEKYQVSVTMPANARNHGATALHQAAETASLRIVELVLEQEGSDIRLQDLMGRLPIHLAVWSGQDRWDIIQALDPKMKTLWKRDHLKRSILHFVAARGVIALAEQILKVAENTQRDVRRLLDNTDKDGWTPLHWACRNPDNNDMVEWLIKKGGSVDKKTEAGWSPRHVAIYHGQGYLEGSDLESGWSGSDNSQDELEGMGDHEVDSDKKRSLPNECARYAYATCNACWCRCYGDTWHCTTCTDESHLADYDLCFKCYKHKDDIHPQNHVFEPLTHGWYRSFNSERRDMVAGGRMDS